jgi:predicted PurR-regulated permease PerM
VRDTIEWLWALLNSFFITKVVSHFPVRTRRAISQVITIVLVVVVIVAGVVIVYFIVVTPTSTTTVYP